MSVHLCMHGKRVCTNICSFVCNEMCRHDTNSLLSPIPWSSPSASSSSVTSGLFTYQFVTQRLLKKCFQTPYVRMCLCVHTVCAHVHHVNLSNWPPSTILTSPYRSSQWSSLWEVRRVIKSRIWEVVVRSVSCLLSKMWGHCKRHVQSYTSHVIWHWVPKSQGFSFVFLS